MLSTCQPMSVNPCVDTACCASSCAVAEGLPQGKVCVIAWACYAQGETFASHIGLSGSVVRTLARSTGGRVEKFICSDGLPMCCNHNVWAHAEGCLAAGARPTKEVTDNWPELPEPPPTQPTDSSCAGGPDCCARWSALVHHVCANAGLPALILAMLGGQTLCCDFGLGAATIGCGASAQLLACVPAELRTRFAGMTPSPHPAAVTHKQTMQAWGANASHVCTVVPIISAFLGTQPLPKPAILASLAMASKFFDRSWFAAHLIQRATKGDEWWTSLQQGCWLNVRNSWILRRAASLM